MDYSKITKELSKETGLSYRKTKQVVNRIFNFIISKSLNEKAVIPGYGRFKVSIRNVNTKFYKGPSYTIIFKPSRSLKEKLRKIYGVK
jgi:nucleoid DNA-binding protein